MQTAEQIISTLDLAPHPSGCTGWFRQTFASSTNVQTPGGERSASTAIFFLQKFGQKSAFHRQRSDEVFHFYQGAALTLYLIDQEGELQKTVLGMDLSKGERPQAVIPAECWVAQRIDGGVDKEKNKNGDFCLTGATVSPGWHLDDKDFLSTEELVKLYPQHTMLILEFND
eukprot:GFUD01001293.1.p1 GENE.GFUD01001293.1~~GFUD01001293.1.p1  ORF type:complete len:200 (+),score=46.87 GFUD01001293.1:90-602(+)